MKFYRNQEIEEIAEARLSELERVLGLSLSPPIPIDILAENVLDLDFLWETINELPGEHILGGLKAKDRLVVINEKHRGLFDQTTGLERSTKGHEMGHWDLFIDKATLDHPVLFQGGEKGPFSFRNSPSGEVEIIKLLYSDPEGREILRKMEVRADHPDEARAVNRYAAAISMPREIIREEALKIDRTSWSNLYELRDKFEVTISALTVRLRQLGLLHIDKDGNLYDSPDAATGQNAFNF